MPEIIIPLIKSVIKSESFQDENNTTRHIPVVALPPISARSLRASGKLASSHPLNVSLSGMLQSMILRSPHGSQASSHSRRSSNFDDNASSGIAGICDRKTMSDYEEDEEVLHRTLMKFSNGGLISGMMIADSPRPSSIFDDNAEALHPTLMAMSNSAADLSTLSTLQGILEAELLADSERQVYVDNDEEVDLDVKIPMDTEEKKQGSFKKQKSAKTSVTDSSTIKLESSKASDADSDKEKKSETDNASSNGSDHEVSKRKVSPLHYGTGWEASLMGFTIVAGGQLYGWNTGFSAGFGSYLIAQLMVGFAYVILLCCLGENTAALAFPGGSYGLARVCLGFYAGYVVACFEMMEYIFMSSAAIFYVGQMAVSCANLDPSYAPVFWVLFYGFGIATTCSSLKVMWYTSTIICITTLSLVLIYCIGSAKYANLAMYGPYWNNTASYVPVMGNNNMTYFLDYTTATVVTQANGMNVTMALGTPLPPTDLWNPSYWFIGGITEWMSTLAVCTWAYAGIECLVLMTDMMKEPKKNIPIGCAGGVALLFATNIATTIVCAAMPPGLFTTVGNPTYMSMVYQLIFPRLSDAGAWLMILPGQIGMGWGFFAPCGKLLQALGQSNLLPRFLCLNGAESHRTGVVVASVIGFILCIAGYFNRPFGAALQNIAIACGCIQYFANCYAYILLKTTFKQVEREFKSPFGIVGAVLCMFIFMLVLISTLFFQSDGFRGTGEYTTLIVICGLIVFLAMWYYMFVTGAQRFSPSEQKTVFRLHVYQFNVKKGKSKESENGIFRNCAPIMAMYGLYATVWNKFDKETKRISKHIDEKFDAWYAQAWQFFMDLLHSSAVDGLPKQQTEKEGRSIMSAFSSMKFRNQSSKRNKSSVVVDVE